MGRFVGVDGCRLGWIAIAGNGGALDYQLFPSMRELLVLHRDAERVADPAAVLRLRGHPSVDLAGLPMEMRYIE